MNKTNATTVFANICRFSNGVLSSELEFDPGLTPLFMLLFTFPPLVLGFLDLALNLSRGASIDLTTIDEKYLWNIKEKYQFPIRKWVLSELSKNTLCKLFWQVLTWGMLYWTKTIRYSWRWELSFELSSFRCCRHFLTPSSLLWNKKMQACSLIHKRKGNGTGNSLRLVSFVLLFYLQKSVDIKRIE